MNMRVVAQQADPGEVNALYRFTAVLIALVLSSCASSSVRPAPRPAPSLSSEASRCDEYMLSKASPAYPESRLRNGVEGWVVLAFDLDGSSKPTNIRLVDSAPNDSFVTASIGAFAARATFEAGHTDKDCAYLIEFKIATW
jgi:outer membrane biosynthesis protein TonB